MVHLFESLHSLGRLGIRDGRVVLVRCVETRRYMPGWLDEVSGVTLTPT